MPESVDKEEQGSERTCIVSGRKDAPEAMLRFALSGDGTVTPDLRRKLPGRGVWTSLDRAALVQAVRKQAFSRGFKTGVRAPDDLPDLVDRLLEQDALQFLSLVNKAGLVTVGFAKVESAIRAGGLAALMHASDGAADGTGKLDRLVKGVEGERAGEIARINVFDSGQLDLALGRTNVIHAALNAGPASAAFLAKVVRLTRYRSGNSELPQATAAGGPPRIDADTSHNRAAGVTGTTHERNEQ